MDQWLLKPTEVANVLGIGRSKAYELIAAGAIPSIRIGASVRVPADSLRAWIAAQTDDAARAHLSSKLDTSGV
jgi:excisionase family DNA binding protein